VVLSNTFVDCHTGLEWPHRYEGYFHNRAYATDGAEAHCAALELARSSDWRLPSVEELRSLLVGCAASELGGACAATIDCQDDCLAGCGGCGYASGPRPDGCYLADELFGIPCGWFWSVTRYPVGTSNRYVVDFRDGDVSGQDWGLSLPVLCVHDRGQGSSR
jgi:hypothetical protein